MDAFVQKKKVSGENRLTVILEQEKELTMQMKALKTKMEALNCEKQQLLNQIK